MTKHLTEDQIARCFAGHSTNAERQHIQQCAECGGELDRLAGSISLFRTAIRDRIDARVAVQAETTVFEDQPPVPGTPIWKWAMVTVVAVLVVALPLFITRPQQFVDNASTTTDPDTLMREINVHLSRTMPAPMEPILTLIPDSESISQVGGVQ
jgi:hypothetical protein